MSQLVAVEVMAEITNGPLCADSYDYNRLPAELRDQAMLAQGTVLTKLGGAVERVIDAGNTLRWAKETLPHGEYLPWVQQACGLKPQRAAELVRAAEWVQMSGNAGTLSEVRDAETLFILSADTTTEEVREWVMERCAAGDPPTRKEVQDRKRGSAEPARQRGLIEETISALKLSPKALDLAAQAQHITTRQLLQELDLDELPKGRRHQTPSATYCKNCTGWWKLPIRQPVVAEPEPVTVSAPDMPAHPMVRVVSMEQAAEALGLALTSLKQRISPKQMQEKGPLIRNGWNATKDGRGFVRLEPAPSPL